MRLNYKFMLSIALMGFLLASCTSASSLTKDISDTRVPPDFGKAPGTILVVRSKNISYNNTLKHNFKKYYKGEYEMVKAKDVLSYTDYGKYRYLFEYSEEFIAGWGSKENRVPAHTNYEFYLTDRVTGISYHLNYPHDAYGKWMKAYLIKLEAARTK